MPGTWDNSRNDALKKVLASMNQQNQPRVWSPPPFLPKKRRVFFSFHYQNDVWRVSQVRNSWVVRPAGEASPFLDHAQWESIKKQGDDAVQRWIDKQLEGSSVTVVLIGSQTAARKWVGYEIQQSHKRKNGLLGIYIHGMKDRYGMTSLKGRNPFSNWHITQRGQKILLDQIHPVYDWVLHDGRNNLPKWIEEAARRAGR